MEKVCRNGFHKRIASLSIAIVVLPVLQIAGFRAFGLGYIVIILNAFALGGWTARTIPRNCLSAKAFFRLLVLQTILVLFLTYILISFNELSVREVEAYRLFSILFGWKYWLLLMPYYLLAALWMWNIVSKRLYYGRGFPRPASPPKVQDKILLSMQIVLIVGLSFLVTFYFRSFPSINFLVFLFVFVLGLHRYYRFFLLDFAPVVLILLVYESLRAFADNLSPSQIHVADIIAIERALFHGQIPAAVLQRFLPWETPFGHVLLIMSLAFYSSHFVLPFILSLWLWSRHPRSFFPFVTGIVLLSLAGFLTYLLFPSAPPWWATYFGYLRGAQAVRSTPPPGLMLSVPNPVAAMPSLHMAYPFFQALFVTSLLGKRGLWIWGFPLGVGFATLYLGHHYVVDLLAGIGYAWVVFLALSFFGLRQDLDGGG